MDFLLALLGLAADMVSEYVHPNANEFPSNECPRGTLPTL
jgi:hypothetical protein